MQIHLIDGTYELYRHFYALPKSQDVSGHEVGAIVGVLNSMLGLLESGATHLGVATDHVIESFRNQLWAGYKTGDGIDPELWSQFHPLEAALKTMGVVVWPMEEFEADDALASAAHRAAADPKVERILICTPDKDLSQCVIGDRVVQLDRRQRLERNEQGVIEKFGVEPTSIPDWLALVGDTADGLPGIAGWGPKSASTILAHYKTLQSIPGNPAEWAVPIRGAARLAGTLDAGRDHALLFKRLATLRLDAPVFRQLEELRWTGPSSDFDRLAQHLGAPELARRALGVR
jgi:5'-3' exonuclease